ncbi:MAG: hypothetical protein PHV25_01355 [Candidatus Pacebacteria bacterium]|nr:hypothetical protein [Candidatus Paceibacterota bacterium]
MSEETNANVEAQFDKTKLVNLALGLIVALAMFGILSYFANGGNMQAGIFSSLYSEEESDVEEEEVEEIITGDYVEQAQAGEGLTHLARRAISTHLDDTESSLNSEQRIFAEDYIQKELGSRMLMLNEEVSISKELVAEAISLAQELTPAQEENLEQYSSLVSFN